MLRPCATGRRGQQEGGDRDRRAVGHGHEPGRAQQCAAEGRERHVAALLAHAAGQRRDGDPDQCSDREEHADAARREPVLAQADRSEQVPHAADESEQDGGEHGVDDHPVAVCAAARPACARLLGALTGRRAIERECDRDRERERRSDRERRPGADAIGQQPGHDRPDQQSGAAGRDHAARGAGGSPGSTCEHHAGRPDDAVGDADQRTARRAAPAGCRPAP